MKKQMQIILQNAPQRGSTDAKMLSAVTIRHFWVLGNAVCDRFNQFSGTRWSLMMSRTQENSKSNDG
ncbi:unnamed protein product [Acanthoscelides obtectus]|uniref:Uncharacterized protein n=1 Tax=Acanthoscelides obtectus TaxID=200917 RepID=A0A9P0PJA9_ACAOB|nr:unnamed protein product [Acanthoscelides obtectus]CAK1646045.1 hypothetical protein AOBTE_LOCUS14411 [Acanthoscelides obtectus]